MKVNRVIIFLIVTSFCLNLSANRGIGENQLIIERDSLKGINTLFLLADDIKVDSISIQDMDYIIDSLIPIGSNHYQYFYSIGYDTSHYLVTVRQLLLETTNDKIHISFVSNYKNYSLKNNPSFKYHRTYDLDLNDSSIMMSSIKYKQIYETIRIDTVYETNRLFFENGKRIFYTAEEYLNGEYYFFPAEPKKRKYDFNDPGILTFDNEKVFSIKIGKSNFIYLKDHWFIRDEYPEHTNIISLLPMKD